VNAPFLFPAFLSLTEVVLPNWPYKIKITNFISHSK
jgi:hypothetical protein